MKGIVKFSRLSHPDRWLLCKIYSLLAGIRLGLWLLSFEQLCKVLEGLSRPSPHINGATASRQQFVQQVIWGVDVSCKQMPGTVKCLARALTVKVLLARHNCDARLVIGVAKNQLQKLEAHAWVEVQGRVVIGQLHDLDRFTPLPTLPQL